MAPRLPSRCARVFFHQPSSSGRSAYTPGSAASRYPVHGKAPDTLPAHHGPHVPAEVGRDGLPGVQGVARDDPRHSAPPTAGPDRLPRSATRLLLRATCDKVGLALSCRFPEDRAAGAGWRHTGGTHAPLPAASGGRDPAVLPSRGSRAHPASGRPERDPRRDPVQDPRPGELERHPARLRSRHRVGGHRSRSGDVPLDLADARGHAPVAWVRAGGLVSTRTTSKKASQCTLALTNFFKRRGRQPEAHAWCGAFPWAVGPPST